MLKRNLVLLILAIAAVFAVACDDSPEEGMAIAAAEIGGPVTAVAGAGTDTAVSVTYRWRPYFDTEGSITEAAPHGDIIVEHYRISWTTVGGSATLQPRDENISVVVPVYDLVSSSIRIVSAAEAGAVTAGTALNANIEFTAREMGTEQEIKFTASVTVNFI